MSYLLFATVGEGYALQPTASASIFCYYLLFCYNHNNNKKKTMKQIAQPMAALHFSNDTIIASKQEKKQ